MPIKQFKDLFLSWPENSQLEVAQLRLKCITSLALVLRLRPSDIAPKGIYLDADEGVIKQVEFSVNDVTFLDNGSMSIMIWEQR